MLLTLNSSLGRILKFDIGIAGVLRIPQIFQRILLNRGSRKIICADFSSLAVLMPKLLFFFNHDLKCVHSAHHNERNYIKSWS